MAAKTSHFRAVKRDEDGEEFVDFLHRRSLPATDTSTQARALAQRLWVFIQQYSHLQEDLQQRGTDDAVTVERYAERWKMPTRSAFRAFEEFSTIFPGEDAAAQVCAELWDGIGRQAGQGEFMQLGAVKVAEEA